MIELTNGVQISEDRLIQKATASVDSLSSTGKLEVMQYDDKMPVAAVTLTSKAVTWTPPEGAALRVRMGKPDGHGVLNDALGMDADGTVYFAFTRQMTAAHGTGEISVEIGSEGGVKSSAIVPVTVKKNPVQDDKIESGDEYLALDAILEQCQQAAKAVTDNADALQTIRDNAEAIQTTAANIGAIKAAPSAANTASEAARTAGTYAEAARQEAANAGTSAAAAKQSADAAAKSAEEAQKAAESAGVDDTTAGDKPWSARKSLASFAPLASALTVSGAGDGLVNLTPTVPWYLQGLRLYGKTTQDGTPSPENPVPLVSAGADEGSVAVTAAGINALKKITIYSPSTDYSSLLLVSELFAPIHQGKQYTLSIDLEAGEQTKAYWNPSSGVFDTRSLDVFPGKKRYSYTFTAKADLFQNIGNKAWLSKSGTGDGIAITPSNACLVPGTDDAYYPAESQALTYATPNGLPGIPVTSGGNYTDETGQQWICDEVDFSSGKIRNNFISGTVLPDNFVKVTISDLYGLAIETNIKARVIQTEAIVYSSMFRAVSYADRIDHTDQYRIYIDGNGNINLRFPAGAMSSESEARSWLDQHSPDYLLLATQDTAQDIPAETLAAYAALQSYAGTTNILAEGCGIEATAIADANAYIASQISQAVAIAKAAQ